MSEPSPISIIFDRVKDNADKFLKETGVTLQAFNESTCKIKIPQKLGTKERLFAALYFRFHLTSYNEAGQMLGCSNKTRDGKLFMTNALVVDALATISLDPSSPTKQPSAQESTPPTRTEVYSTPTHSAQETPSTEPYGNQPTSLGMGEGLNGVRQRLSFGSPRSEVKSHVVSEAAPSFNALSMDDFEGKFLKQFNKQFKDTKYVIRDFFPYRKCNDLEKKSLLVWDSAKNCLQSSEEFLRVMEPARTPSLSIDDTELILEATLDMITINQTNVECNAPKIEAITIAGTDLVCQMLIPSRHCEQLFDRTDIVPVFHPSYKRPNQLAKGPYDHDKITMAGVLRIVVVDPADAEEYAKIYLPQNCVVLIIPKDNMGIGYKRYVIQLLAHTKSWRFVWMIDDSICSFLRYTYNESAEKFIRGEVELKDFLAEAYARVAKSFSADDLCSVGTVGCNKDRGGQGTSYTYKEMYASSAFLLNVQATCERGIYFDPAHRCAEDICFHAQCIRAGLTCVVDTIYAVVKSQKLSGGASDQTQKERAMILAREVVESDVEDDDDVTEDATITTQEQVTLSPSEPTLANLQSLSILPLVGPSNEQIYAVSGCRVGEVHMHSARNDRSDFTFPGCQNLCLSAGIDSRSIYTFDPKGKPQVWRIFPGEGGYQKGSTLSWVNDDPDLKIASLIESDTNTCWLASNKKDCRRVNRIDHRMGEITLQHEVKRGCQYSQLFVLDEHNIVALQINGHMTVFDDRTGRPNHQLAKATDDILMTNSHLNRKARIYSGGGQHLLTYTSFATRRCGVVLSSNLQPLYENPLLFKHNADPSYSLKEDGTVVLTEISNSLRGSIVKEWRVVTGRDVFSQSMRLPVDQCYMANVLPACTGKVSLPDALDSTVIKFVNIQPAQEI
jgi:hypothetical protein